jgi:hypothetical protein
MFFVRGHCNPVFRGIRMLATATSAKAGTPEREAASLDLMFFESHGGAWLLRSEPSTTVHLDPPASLEICTRNTERAQRRHSISPTASARRTTTLPDSACRSTLHRFI